MISPLSEENQTLHALSALAQVQRLRAFRALVVAGAAGLSAGALAQQLELAPSSLSFHLKQLVHANLIHCQAQGRFLIYRANFERMNAVLAYLSEHCCQGQVCDLVPSTCAAPLSTSPLQSQAALCKPPHL